MNNPPPRPRQAHRQSSDELLHTWVDQVRSVRQRMVLQDSLKMLAFALVGIPVYVVLFAWIDHHLHLGPLLRLLALLVLVAGCGALLWKGLHLFRRHISLSCAANAVEGKHCLDQQLVAAIEYYEQQDNYPYSRNLVDQMIQGLAGQVRDVRFKTTVPAWPTWLSAAVIAISLLAVTHMGVRNFQYYHRYLTRLTQPTAAIAPLPATILANQTGALLVAPQESFSMLASITGRIPKRGQVVIEPDPNGACASGLKQTLPVQVTQDSNGVAELKATWSLPQKGAYRYQFAAGKATSDWQAITVAEFPEIKKVSARVTFGKGPAKETTEEDVKANNLTVYKQSKVELTLQATQPLKEVQAIGPQGDVIATEIDANDSFKLTFTAREDGPLVFTLTNTEGHPNRKDQRIELLLKKNQPPKIELLSPGGDYVATNVASIPIQFAVNDDMGLEKASITLEFNNGQTRSIPLDVTAGSKSADGLYELELEQYHLDISDSLIYYAQASDRSAIYPAVHLETVTEPYFIEIRPYRQLIHQAKPGMPNMPKQGLELEKGHEKLMAILEYTRAFLKKTWALAQYGDDFDEPDKKKLDALSRDIDYTIEQLTLIREDPRYQFSGEQIAQINSILNHFGQATKLVCTYHPTRALTPEKKGYFELRALIKELEKILMPPMQGPPPPKERDKYKVEEQLHVKRYDKERLEWELEQLNQKLAELAREQDKLQQEFLNFLEQQKKAQAAAQQAHGRETWREDKPLPSSPPGSLPPEGEPGQTPPSSVTTEGAQAWQKPDPNNPSPPAAGGGQQNQQAKQNDQDKPPNAQQAKPQGVQPSELMRMMQAQQKALQEKLDQLTKQLKSLPQQASGQGQGRGQGSGQTQGGDNPHRQEAQKQLKKAAERMEEFDQAMAKQYYQSEPKTESLEQAHNLLSKTEGHLRAAREALAQEVGDDDTLAELQAEARAQELEELARQYDPSVSPEKQQVMQELLEQAKAQLEQMPEGWWKQETAPMNGNANPTNTPPQMGTPGGTPGARGLGRSNRTGGLNDNMRQQIRKLAQSFWSASMTAQKEDSPLVQPQISHPRYSECENLFFELSATPPPSQEVP